MYLLHSWICTSAISMELADYLLWITKFWIIIPKTFYYIKCVMHMQYEIWSEILLKQIKASYTSLNKSRIKIRNKVVHVRHACYTSTRWKICALYCIEETIQGTFCQNIQGESFVNFTAVLNVLKVQLSIRNYHYTHTSYFPLWLQEAIQPINYVLSRKMKILSCSWKHTEKPQLVHYTSTYTTCSGSPTL